MSMVLKPKLKRKAINISIKEIPVTMSALSIGTLLTPIIKFLGSFFTTLWKVILPLSVPGIVSGVTMVFVPALTTFAISNILGGGKIYLIGNVIEQEFTTNSNWNVGSGLSMILMLFIILSMAVLSRYDNGEGAMF